MYDHIPVIHDQPAFPRLPIHAAFFLEILFCSLLNTFGKGVQHAVTGAVANDEIICKRSDLPDVEEQDVLGYFVFQGFDDLMCKFESVQFSPRVIWSGAEKSLVYTEPPGFNSLL